MATPGVTMFSYTCSFATGMWNAGDWSMVKRHDWDHYGRWLQRDAYIENETPVVPDLADLEWKPEEGLDFEGKLMTRTHTGMVYAQPAAGDFHVASTLAFTRRMSPSIVFGTLTDSARPTHRQYRESWEIVLWDEGINVWRQTLPDGVVHWDLIGYAKFPSQAHTRYLLDVRREGQTLHVQVGDHRFGLLDPELPESCYVGITGCEGINRFYDFQLTT